MRIISEVIVINIVKLKPFSLTALVVMRIFLVAVEIQIFNCVWSLTQVSRLDRAEMFSAYFGPMK